MKGDAGLGAPPVRTAVVTGAASGIGAGIVARLRSRGVRVVAGDRSTDVETMFGAGTDVVGVSGDVTSPQFAQQLVTLAEESSGPVDLLVHSAGIMPAGSVADTDTDTFISVMDVNYGGTVRMVKAVLPGMRARHRGQIVVLGSLTGYVPTRNFSAYSASKAAVNTLVETLAHEESDNGVQVLLVAPNAVKTPLLAQAAGGSGLLAKLNEKSSSPLMLTTDDVLDAIDHGLSKKRKVVTPGGTALYALRRLTPAGTWALTNRLG